MFPETKNSISTNFPRCLPMLLVFSLSLYPFSLRFLFCLLYNFQTLTLGEWTFVTRDATANNKRHRTTLSDRKNCFRLNNFVHETYDGTRFWKKERAHRGEKKGKERKRLKALYDDAKNFELVDYEWSKYKSCWKQNIKHAAIAWKNLSTRKCDTIYIRKFLLLILNSRKILFNNGTNIIVFKFRCKIFFVTYQD